MILRAVYIMLMLFMVVPVSKAQLDSGIVSDTGKWYNFCNELISSFGEGIAKSMQYLSQDKQYLHSLLTPRILYLQSLRQKLSNSVFSQDSHTDKIHHTQQCAIFSFQKNKPYMLLLACDKVSKMYGYVLTILLLAGLCSLLKISFWGLLAVFGKVYVTHIA